MNFFWKLQATGNDFIFINNLPETHEKQITNKVRSLCERRIGIGADGLVYFWEAGGVWNWHYRNSDGSIGEFCGNASLCLARLLREEFHQKELSWQTLVGIVKAQYTNGIYSIFFPKDRMKRLSLNKDLERELYPLNERGLKSLAFINAGVPHLVLINHETWSLEDRLPLNMDLRKHPLLGPAGANITWYSPKDSSLVCFERGVDSETLGCGSAALAAYMALEEHKEKTFHFLGGDLHVEDGPQHFLLKGKPELVFEGIIR